jgi:hypothetical protein
MNDSASEFCAQCGADGQTAKRAALVAGEPSSAQVFSQLPVGSRPASGLGASLRPGETIEQGYLRQIRNAVVFIAWIIGIIFVVYLIFGIIVARNG